IAVEGHNIKLGRGGIREIEFFVQTQQLIAGGRYPELRIKETLQTLEALAGGGWIDEQVRDHLAAAYRFLGGGEDRLQRVAGGAGSRAPSLARRSRWARTFCSLRRLPRSGRFCAGLTRSSAQCAASLCDAVRECARHRGRPPHIAVSV